MRIRSLSRSIYNKEWMNNSLLKLVRIFRNSSESTVSSNNTVRRRKKRILQLLTGDVCMCE
jgi:hypothetical protein